jgi:hypothetical protein
MNLWQLILVADATWFLLGALLMYLFLRYVKRILLDLPKTNLTSADIREWMERDKEIRETNRQTREILSKLSGNV